MGVDRTLAVILLCLAVSYVIMSAFVIRRTNEGQQNVESFRYLVSSRVVDVIGNVAVVQCFARMAAESAAMRGLTDRMLKAQYPVLVWWGVLVVLQRAAATLTMIAIFVAGAWTAGDGNLTVGGIVSCAGLASLLIGKLDQLSGFVTSLHQSAAPLDTFFASTTRRAASRIRHMRGRSNSRGELFASKASPIAIRVAGRCVRRRSRNQARENARHRRAPRGPGSPRSSPFCNRCGARTAAQSASVGRTSQTCRLRP